MDAKKPNQVPLPAKSSSSSAAAAAAVAVWTPGYNIRTEVDYSSKSLLLPVLGFLFLTFNYILAVYRSRRDPWTVAFVVSSYAALLLLFWCLRALEGLPPAGSSAKKETLKVAIWTLAMILNVMFSYRVSTMLPPAVAAIIWLMAGISAMTIFYLFFIYRGVGGRGNPTAAATKI